MAREILFKAKRKDNGEWVEGYVFDDGYENGRMFVGSLEIQEYQGSACDEWDIVGTYFYEVDKNTICQYTGLTDNNGNKIWENDVVDASKGWWYASGPAGHSSPIIKVEWDEGFCGFVPFADYDCDCGVYIGSSEVEVIGNIFDNPELLGGVENG